MKALLLYNPKSGHARIGKHLDDIIEIFRKAQIDIRAKRIEFSKNPLADDCDVELVVICGGDGTINFVVNNMRKLNINPLIGIIPAGTANDFAGALGMSRNILRAAQQIAYGSERKVDCGLVNNTHFVNVLSFGVLTTTSQQTSDREKRVMGKLAYVRVGLKDLHRKHRIPLHIKSDNEEFDVDAMMFLAFIGETAGRFPLARMSKIDDGLLDVLILEYRNLLATCWNMLRYLCGGKPRSVRYIQTKTLSVTTMLHENTDVDGQAGPDFPMVITCLKDGLRVRC